MKKMFMVLAATFICGAFLFTSCSKDDDNGNGNDNGNVVGTYTLDYDVLNDNNLSESKLERLEDILDEMVEDVVYENVTLNEVVEEVKAMIQEYGPGLAAQFPNNYFTVQFGIVNDKDEWVKEVYAKCKDGQLI